MDWIVKNTLNRDTERQHLNKILADIRASMDAVSGDSSTLGGVKDIVGGMVEGNTEQGVSVDYDPVQGVLNFVINDFVIQLTGDVTGEGTVHSAGNVSIALTIAEDKLGIQDAPIDNQTYWRKNGEWEVVPDNILTFLELKGEGVPILYQDDVSLAYSWVIREFEAETGELVVTNPTGENGNPKYGLATVGDTGTGTSIVDVDSFGRVIGKSPDSFVFTQSTAASTWTINHNLNRKVSAAVYTTGGMQMWADVLVVSSNQLQVQFDGLYDGYVVIH